MARIEIKQILCPVDLSAQSRHALNHAVMLAQWYQAKVMALEVIWTPLPPFPMNPVSPVIRSDQLEGYADDLRRFVEASHPAGIEVSTAIQEGPVVRRILDQASRMPADLIVMGTHGTSGVEHLVLGSITEKVLRQAFCPVLTVPPAVSAAPATVPPFKTILCAIDFSPSSLRALTFAVSLAQESGGRLVVVYVLEWPTDGRTSRLGLEVAAFRQQLIDEAKRELAAAIPADVRTWCDVVELTAVGKPHEEIIRLAGEQHANVIVLGVHGRNVLSLAFLGSTTNQVVRTASCPVLTVGL